MHLAAAGQQKVHLYVSFRVKRFGHLESLRGTVGSMPTAEAHASNTKEKKKPAFSKALFLICWSRLDFDITAQMG